MGQSPSSGTISRRVCHEIPRILWNKEVHYRVHKSQPIVAMLDQNNHVRVEVFTALTMRSGVFLDVTACGSCKNHAS
jgi:hypothetical protein